MRKLIAVLAVAAMFSACGGGSQTTNPETAQATTTDANATPGGAASTPAAPAATAPAAAVAPTPTYREVTIPAGTALRLDLQSNVASDTSHVEDPVRATLRSPVLVNGETVIPAGAEAAGTVTGAERSGRVKGRARVAYRFDSLRVDGERYDIKTAAISQLARATKGKDATKIAIGAGAGAVVGALLGGGGGAAKGAAVGGAGGTGAVLATRGDEVRLGPGANVTAKLTAPLKIRVRVS